MTLVNGGPPAGPYCEWTYDSGSETWTADDTHCPGGSCIPPADAASPQVVATSKHDKRVTHDVLRKKIDAINVEIGTFNANSANIKKKAALKPLGVASATPKDAIYFMSCY